MFLLQILVGIAALCGFLFLPSAWGIPIFLVWALQMIFWVFLQEYYPYADKIRVLSKGSAVFGIVGSSGTVGVGTA